MEPKVYIILLNYITWNDTVECLDSLLQLNYSNKTIVVVDNDSPNQSYQHLLDWAQQKGISFGAIQDTDLDTKQFSTGKQAAVILIKSAKNGGFAAGNNIGIRYAMLQNDHDYLWLLNNDTIADSESLSNLVTRAENDKAQGRKTGIWGSKLLYYHQPTIIQALGGRFNFTTLTSSHIHEGEPDNPVHNVDHIEQDYVVGAALFVSRKFLEEIGLMNEDYFLYFEELDWATRAKKSGFSLGYVWSSKVYHKEGKTIGSNSDGKTKSKLADYHGIRSKIIFFKKYYPERTFKLYTSLLASAMLRIKRLQFSRAITIVKLMANIK